MVFQDAHFELARRGDVDVFGVHAAATLSTKTGIGVHFTPPGLARAIVEQALQAYGDVPPNITILDPACGSGSILYEALRTLRDSGYTGKIRVIGFDESQSAVEMTRFLLSVMKGDWPNFPISQISIECRDSLDEREWPRADIILMNPPFVSWRWLSANQKRALDRILGKYARGRPDLSMAFIERSLQALIPGGVIGSILPAGVLSMTYARDWRRHLLDEASISFLAVFGELGLFRLATVETGCVVLHKVPSDSTAVYKSLWVGEKRDATPTALRYLRRATYPAIMENDLWTLTESPVTKLRDNPTWRPQPGAIAHRLEQIRQLVQTRVGDIFEVRQGALPAPRDAFIIDTNAWKALTSKERRWFRRVAENQNIRSGQILTGEFIFFTRSPGLPPIEGEELIARALPQFFQTSPPV